MKTITLDTLRIIRIEVNIEDRSMRIDYVLSGPDEKFSQRGSVTFYKDLPTDPQTGQPIQVEGLYQLPATRANQLIAMVGELRAVMEARLLA